MKRCLFLMTFLIVCHNNNYAFRQQKLKSREISFFRMTGFFQNFRLKINNDFSYEEKKQMKGNAALGHFITKYHTTSDTIHLYLKINNRDTAFNYVLSKYDSLMLGGSDSYFFCWTKKEYIWAND